MTYHFQYEPDYPRIMFAVLVDNRASIPAIKNQVGSVIKIFCDSQVELITDKTIVYRVETDLGVMAGFFAVTVNTDNKTGNLLMKSLRPAFHQFDSDISVIIANFIQNNSFHPDYLF